MGLFDFIKKILVPHQSQPNVQQSQHNVPPPQIVPSALVQIHKAPIVPGNIAAIKTDCFVLHFETTGFNAYGDTSKVSTSMITAIKCARFKDMQMVDHFYTLVNPGRPIMVDAFEASGISNQMVQTAPTIEQAFPHFINYFQDAFHGTLVLVYNADFTSKFLQATMQRLMISGDIRMFDVMKLADKKILTDNYPTMMQAMKASKYKDRELKNDIHKCQAIAKIAFTLVDVPDNSIEVK